MGLSRRAFAAQVGVSSTAIQKMVAKGKLPLDAEGRIPMPAGLHAYLACRAVAPPSPASPSSSPASATDPGPSLSAGADAASKALQAGLELSTSIREAELQQKRASARLAELKFEQKRGQLVAITEVEDEARTAGDAIRTALLAIAPRVAPRLEALCAATPGGAPRTIAIQRLVDEEINRTLGLLHARRFTAATPAPPPAPPGAEAEVT